MITEELFLELLQKAAQACGKERPEEAVQILTSGGIPPSDALQTVDGMMNAEPAIREHQERERQLIRLRDQVPDGRRCIVVTTNGNTPNLAKLEALHIWNTIVKAALADSSFDTVFCQGIEPTPLAVQAVSKASLLIFILSDRAQELDWLQSQAQTLGKPIVPLVTNGREIELTLPLLSAPLYYTCRQIDDSFEVDDPASLVDRLKQRISEPNKSEGQTGYSVTRRIYDEPLRTIGALSVRETIYTEKLRSLHELHVSLSSAWEKMDSDYELSRGEVANLNALVPFAETLTESALTFQNDCQCLHKAMRTAVGALPKSQQNESLAVCESMKVLLQHLGDFIVALQSGEAAVRSREGRKSVFDTLNAEIRNCCRLIPDREALVKSAATESEDSVGSMDVVVKQFLVVKQFAVEAALKKAVQQPIAENIKDFCRAIRSALLRWLGLDRRAPGAYDPAAEQIRSYGRQLHSQFALTGPPGSGASEVWAAILQHVAGFGERLKLDRGQRAGQDLLSLQKFVQSTREQERRIND